MIIAVLKKSAFRAITTEGPTLRLVISQPFKRAITVLRGAWDHTKHSYADFSKATVRLVVLSVKLRWLVTKKALVF